MAVELNGKVWKKFVEFFRTEKGYEDWTEQEIDNCRVDDDITEFMTWLVNELEVEILLRHRAVVHLAKEHELHKEDKGLNKLLNILYERG